MDDTLEAQATAALIGTGVTPERAAQLAAGDEPVTDYEHMIAAALVSGYTASGPAPEPHLRLEGHTVAA